MLADTEADTSKNVNHIEHLPSSEQDAKQIPETIAARETVATPSTSAAPEATTSRNDNHIEHSSSAEKEAEQTPETITTGETIAASEADTSPNVNRIEYLPLAEQKAQLFSISTDTDEQAPETTATPGMTTSETTTPETHTSNNVILVHCDVGVSRSATIMVGYPMRKHRIPLSDALAMVKEKQRIKPSSNSIEQLNVWEDTGYEVYEDVETKVPKLQYQKYLDRRAERLKEKGLTGNEPIVPLTWEDLDMMSKSARKKSVPQMLIPPVRI